MREFVIDDVDRQAGVDGVLLRTEVVELKRLAVAIVERVLAVTGMRHDDQPVSFERPRDRASERRSILEEGQRALQERPETDLVKLERVDRRLVEHLPAVADERLRVLAPHRRQLELSGIAVVVDDREAGAGRSVGQPRFPRDVDFFVDRLLRISLGDKRILEVGGKREE